MLTFLPLPAIDLPPVVPREFRAAWVATVDNIDWPSKKDLSADQQRKELVRILDTSERIGLNAIIFQVRPSCDSLYESKLEPWSEFLTGRQGKPPSPIWDPLEFAVKEAHRRGIELHAWVNPYRAKHFKATGPLAGNHIRNRRPDIAKTYGRYLWLDPGEPEAAAHTLRVIEDIVSRYDIDGLHIDDYFYSYSEKDSQGKAIPFPDDGSYSRYVAGGGTLSKADWRRDNVNRFVEKMYKSVKAKKPWVKVGISPFGIYRPGIPKGIVAGIDQYDFPLYADCLKWLRSGWCDYFSPQLYWKLDSTGQPFRKLLDWWMEQNVANRHIWPGLYTGRMNPSNGDWPLDEISNQIAATRNANAGGAVHFSFNSFLRNDKGISDLLRTKLYAAKSLPPESGPAGTVPTTPQITKVEVGSLTNVVRFKPGKEYRFVCLVSKAGGPTRILAMGDAGSGELVVPSERVQKGLTLHFVSRRGIIGPGNSTLDGILE